MIAIITHSIEGRMINKYRGTFMGESLMEPNLWNGIFASVTGFFEAWSGSYESKLAGARIVSNKKLDESAIVNGGNAFFAALLVYKVVNQLILMVSVGRTVAVN
jgi:uncharacterized protein YbjQ (UPF0145 family)